MGGVINNIPILTVKYEVTWFLKCFCLCAVNCYAMASGYLLADKKFRLSRIVTLWFEVEIYSLLVSIFSTVVTGNELSVKQIVMSAMPFISKQYWYFTIYVGVFFLSPYINLIIRRLEKNTLEKLLITIFVLVCMIPAMFNFDLFETPTGSLFWMSYCYLLGGYIRKYGIRIKRPLLYYGAGAVTMWVIRIIYEMWRSFTHEEYAGGIFLIFNTYVSPFCLLSAIGLFLYCINKNIKNERHNAIIRSIAKASFAVYLVHDNGIFKKYIWNDLFAPLCNLNPILMILIILLIALVVYSICMILEEIRIKCCSGIERLILKTDEFNQIFEAESEK